jgi:5-formyltetrahydrofolate cyclo-ligase
MKGLLRAQFKQVAAQVGAEELAIQWQALELRVLDFCLCLESGRPEVGDVVTLFGGLPDEVDLVSTVGEGLRGQGLRTALFGLRVNAGGGYFPGEMDAYVVSEPSQVRRGRLGIWEPNCDQTSLLMPDELDLVLLPGLFFSPGSGARLGRGGGYFDRYLARVPRGVPRVGVALEWQLRDELPIDDHDQFMDWVVTEERVIRCG